MFHVKPGYKNQHEVRSGDEPSAYSVVRDPEELFGK